MDAHNQVDLDTFLTSTTVVPPVKRKRGRPPKPKALTGVAHSLSNLTPPSEIHSTKENKKDICAPSSKDNFALNLTQSFFSSLSDLSSLQMPISANTAYRLNDLRTVPLPAPSTISSCRQPILQKSNPQTPQKGTKRNKVVFPLSSPPCIRKPLYDNSAIDHCISDDVDDDVELQNNLICTPNDLQPSVFINTPITSTHDYYKRMLTSSPNVPRDHVDPSLILQRSSPSGDHSFANNECTHQSSDNPTSQKSSAIFNPNSPITPRTFSNIIHSSPLYHGYYSSPSQPSRFSLKPIPMPLLRSEPPIYTHAECGFDDICAHHSYDNGFFAQSSLTSINTTDLSIPSIKNTNASHTDSIKSSHSIGDNKCSVAQYPYKLRPATTFSVSDGLLLEDSSSLHNQYRSHLPLRSLSLSPSPSPSNLRSLSPESLPSSFLSNNTPQKNIHFLQKATKGPSIPGSKTSWCEKREIRFAVSSDGQAIIEQVKILKRRIPKYSRSLQFDDCYNGDSDDEYDLSNDIDFPGATSDLGDRYFQKKVKISRPGHYLKRKLKRRETAGGLRYSSTCSFDSFSGFQNKKPIVKPPGEPMTPTGHKAISTNREKDSLNIDPTNKYELNMDQCDNHGALLTPICLSGQRYPYDKHPHEVSISVGTPQQSSTPLESEKKQSYLGGTSSIFLS